MTESEIMKALECCTKHRSVTDCKKCPCFKTFVECNKFLTRNALDLINRKNAEIERLQENTKIIMPARSQGKTQFIAKKYNAVRAEAIKEFAERVVKITHRKYGFTNPYVAEVLENLDQIAKEMGVEL